VLGVRLADGREVRAGAVILTTGTFLGGELRSGTERIAGGRVSDGPGAALSLSEFVPMQRVESSRAAGSLSASLRRLGIRQTRLKTGTPPRLRADSIDFTQCEPQPLHRVLPFSFHMRENGDPSSVFAQAWARGLYAPGSFCSGGGYAPEAWPRPLVNCYRIITNERAHAIVRDAIAAGELPTFSSVSPFATSGGSDGASSGEAADASRDGVGAGTVSAGRRDAATNPNGPRYCPSFETKVLRFSHQGVFAVVLEPETLRGDVVYPNGLSMSLPTRVQLAVLRTLPGLARA
jgi:tRNA uridine 5-carboxymethylaminomethyl modification enzyme